jgi:biotin synthase
LARALCVGEALDVPALAALLEGSDEESDALLRDAAVRVRKEIYGNTVYVRGLIEVSSFCKNDCLYCGIRRSNRKAERYRLTPEEIVACAEEGYALGFRTVVLQGGEDGFFTDALLCGLIDKLKTAHPDCAVTLSLGERSRESYQALFDAGADRYLLRHETATRAHYEKLHPAELSFENRLRCLSDLREIGYQVGAGFMVGSPYQTEEDLADEMIFLRDFGPHMVGIGPFIPHSDTPFAGFEAGTAEMTVFLLSLIRLTLPRVLLPATTALGTIDARGREKGLEAGANVLMPNLSPGSVRKKYLLYDNKICTGEEAAQCVDCLSARVRSTGNITVSDRGDYNNEI